MFSSFFENAFVSRVKARDQILDDTIPSDPLRAGAELCGDLRGVFSISHGPIHFLYEVSRQATTIFILGISDGPMREVHMQQAEIICTEHRFRENCPQE